MKITSLLLVLFLACSSVFAQQSVIEVPKGYSDDIGQMISMLDNLKARVERNVRNLDQNGTDFLLDDHANSPGAIIYHLAATEAYYQVYTIENRGFNAEERRKWDTALNLGDKARQEFKGKPISYYLEIYDEVRAKTKALLKTKDDAWFKEKIGTMNIHWAWFHVMEHQANHMGQLALIVKRI
ncbi:DinB family protein [Psychroserpens sp. SPM9]|uniref:DinB family protein n=1 Tax=Psychroserpens sp. SPM9 TaxID=2975598 RepID=UPI0021A5BEFF|nr:DinB family protein [Psychroserpens sp. SPM9]MDG5492501.1 DinB family protein [Psychroserpens sp. SPM9]